MNLDDQLELRTKILYLNNVHNLYLNFSFKLLVLIFIIYWGLEYIYDSTRFTNISGK